MTFVAKVDRTVAEATRYRTSQARLRRQLASEALAIGALGASFALVARAPEIGELLAAAPSLALAPFAGLTLVWLLIARSRLGTLA